MTRFIVSWRIPQAKLEIQLKFGGWTTGAKLIRACDRSIVAVSLTLRSQVASRS